jgi:hypothetical protein
MNIIYSIIMLALVDLTLTAQTAFATNGNESKGLSIFPKRATIAGGGR